MWRQLSPFPALCLLFTTLFSVGARAQTTGLDLFRSLATAPLDGKRVFHIRDADLDLEDLHLTFEEGTIAFTQSIDGSTTGALFVGEGSILVIPPNQVERASLSRFTQSAVLNERFHSVYLRFHDDTTVRNLESALRGPERDTPDFLAKYAPLAKNLAGSPGDALRLTLALLNTQSNVRYVHASIAGDHLGTFDAVYDQSAAEAILVTHAGRNAAGPFQDVWLSFSSKSQRNTGPSALRRRQSDEPVTQTDQLQPDENGLTSLLDIHSFDISADVTPPKDISALAKLRITARRGGVRAALFQLSRNLKVASAKLDGAPIEFLQNPAIPGSQTERTGNDLIAIVLPAAIAPGNDHILEFTYAGPVMTDTGGGLLYVGDHGTWYPNFGIRNAQFDLRFQLPKSWKLVATGETVPDSGALHFRTSKPVPVAGFNLGLFTTAQAAPSSRSAVISVLATAHSSPPDGTPLSQIATDSASIVNFLEQHLGPFPYHALSISEVPGGVSQGWPGLVYLSSAAFSKTKLGAEPRTEFARIVAEHLMLPHEIGHQYWGDNVTWRSYREQWIMEALANYCALMFLEQRDPEVPRSVLSYYRGQLLKPTATNAPLTLGLRLDSSLAPEGYVDLTYGRGTWLIHMLRSMLRDAAVLEGRPEGADAAFWQALRSLQSDYTGRAIGQSDLQSALERALPRNLRYEGAASLAWFFDDWINGASVPRFALSDVKISSTGAASGTIATTGTPKDFTALLPVYAESKEGKQVLAAQLFADDPDFNFHIKVPPGTVKLLLDPKHEVLRRE